MSEKKHTPGPWVVKPNGGFQNAAGNLVPHSSAWKEDAWCDWLATDESEANDRLISAAPDMLDALELAVAIGMVPVTSASEGGAAKFSEQVRVADMIRAAIKKARGEK